jgi:hypothetical protein
MFKGVFSAVGILYFVHSPPSITLSYPLSSLFHLFNSFQYTSLCPLSSQMPCFTVLPTLYHSLFLFLFPRVPWSSSTIINFLLVSCLSFSWGGVCYVLILGELCVSIRSQQVSWGAQRDKARPWFLHSHAYLGESLLFAELKFSQCKRKDLMWMPTLSSARHQNICEAQVNIRTHL